MARERLLDCTFLIPTRRDSNLSDGKAHHPRTWKWLRCQLYQFGGGTVAGDLAEGWYLDRETGQAVTDRSRKYTVAVRRALLGPLREVLREACRVFCAEVHLFECCGPRRVCGEPRP